jgi:hypothetical protein
MSIEGKSASYVTLNAISVLLANALIDFTIRQDMTDTNREGDWVGDRFKLYAGSVREANFYDPWEDIEDGMTSVRCSVLEAWTAYATSRPLFPNLLFLGMKFDSWYEPDDEQVAAVMNLVHQVLARPLFRIELAVPASTQGTPHYEMDLGSDMALLDRASHSVLGSLSRYQQKIQELTLVHAGAPSSTISEACQSALLQLHFLRTARIELQPSNDVLVHLGSLPYLRLLSVLSLPTGLALGTASPPRASFFPALQTLRLRLADEDIPSCMFLLSAITSSCLHECYIGLEFAIATSKMGHTVGLARALASNESLIFVELEDLSGTDIELDDKRFKDLVKPFAPLYRLSSGTFQLSLRGIYFNIRDEAAVEVYPLLQFVHSRDHYLSFRVETLQALAKAYPDLHQSATPLGIVLDRDLEMDWQMFEPMPGYTHLAIDADLTRGSEVSFTSYAPILRTIFPRLQCLYALNTTPHFLAFWDMLAASLGNIQWVDLYDQ